jgi:DNA-binding ferritin-like protein (Dps family)
MAGKEIQRPSWLTEFVMQMKAEEDKVVFLRKSDPSYSPSVLLQQQSLEIVNIAEIVKTLENDYQNSKEMMKEYLKELMPEVLNDKNPVDELVSFITNSQNDPADAREKIDSDVEKQLKALINEMREEAAKLHKELDEEEAPEDALPNSFEPVTVNIPKVALRDFGSFKRTIGTMLDKIYATPEPRPTSPNARNVKQMPKQDYIDRVMKPIFDMLKGLEDYGTDTELEVSLSRKSDGSFNVIANSALYNGMLFRPTETFTQMKDEGEQIKMPFNIILFAKNDELVQKIEENQSLENSKSSTPFNTNPFVTDLRK